MKNKPMFTYKKPKKLEYTVPKGVKVQKIAVGKSGLKESKKKSLKEFLETEDA